MATSILMHVATASMIFMHVTPVSSYDLEYTTPIFGNIDALGYYYVELMIGSPAQKASAILDFGVEITAIPCDTCQHCGHHMDRPFMTSMSDTHAWQQCGLGCPGQCIRGHCHFTKSFNEGSSIQGRFFHDLVTFPRGPSVSELPSVNATLGCTERESGAFYAQKADGIFGMGGRSLLRKFLDTHFLNGVSFCLAEWGGSLRMGSKHHEAVYGPSHRVRLLNDCQDSCQLPSVQRMCVGEGDCGVTGFNKFRNTILDIGTTYTYMSSAAYSSLTSAIHRYCDLHDNCLAALRTNAKCWTLRGYDGPIGFPTLRVFFTENVVDGRPSQAVLWQPHAYMYRNAGNPKRWCLAFEDDGPGAETTLGSSFMVNQDTFVDFHARSVEFQSARCVSFHSRPSTSSIPSPLPLHLYPRRRRTWSPASGVQPSEAPVEYSRRRRTWSPAVGVQPSRAHVEYSRRRRTWTMYDFFSPGMRCGFRGGSKLVHRPVSGPECLQKCGVSGTWRGMAGFQSCKGVEWWGGSGDCFECSSTRSLYDGVPGDQRYGPYVLVRRDVEATLTNWSNDDLVVGVLETILRRPASAGEFEICVLNTFGFHVGQVIVIGEGMYAEQVKLREFKATGVYFNAFLSHVLQFDHKAGEKVTVFASTSPYFGYFITLPWIQPSSTSTTTTSDPSWIQPTSTSTTTTSDPSWTEKTSTTTSRAIDPFDKGMEIMHELLDDQGSANALKEEAWQRLSRMFYSQKPRRVRHKNQLPAPDDSVDEQDETDHPWTTPREPLGKGYRRVSYLPWIIAAISSLLVFCCAGLVVGILCSSRLLQRNPPELRTSLLECEAVLEDGNDRPARPGSSGEQDRELTSFIARDQKNINDSGSGFINIQ